jgi:hypothetical protein
LLAQGSQSTHSQASLDRLRAHLLAQLVCLGRHTLSGLLTTNGQLHRDWSADYRLYSHQRIEAAELYGQIRRGVQESLQPDEALLVAMDDSILRKSGRKIPGVGYRRDPLSPSLSCQLCSRDAFRAALGAGSAARWILPYDSDRFPTGPFAPSSNSQRP